MEFLQEFSEIISNLIGISAGTVLLIIYSIIAIIIIDLIEKGIVFLNKNEKVLYLFNKKMKVFKGIIIVLALLIIWGDQIKNIITFISFTSAAATLALKDIIINFFAGIYISLCKPFRVEDRIEVDGMIGDIVNTNSLNFEILEVSARDEGEQSTGIIIQIPNSKIFTD